MGIRWLILFILTAFNFKAHSVITISWNGDDNCRDVLYAMAYTLFQNEQGAYRIGDTAEFMRDPDRIDSYQINIVNCYTSSGRGHYTSFSGGNSLAEFNLHNVPLGTLLGEWLVAHVARCYQQFRREPINCFIVLQIALTVDQPAIEVLLPAREISSNFIDPSLNGEGSFFAEIGFTGPLSFASDLARARQFQYNHRLNINTQPFSVQVNMEGVRPILNVILAYLREVVRLSPDNNIFYRGTSTGIPHPGRHTEIDDNGQTSYLVRRPYIQHRHMTDRSGASLYNGRQFRDFIDLGDFSLHSEACRLRRGVSPSPSAQAVNALSNLAIISRDNWNQLIPRWHALSRRISRTRRPQQPLQVPDSISPLYNGQNDDHRPDGDGGSDNVGNDIRNCNIISL